MPDYFERTHHGSFWRQRGNQPLLFRRRLQKIEATTTGRRLLDIGSGEGHFAALAAKRGWTINAMDYLIEGVQRSQRRLGNVVVRGDAQALPYTESVFDVVALWDVLEHLPDPGRTLAEARRVLRPGGLLAWSTPNTEALSVRLKGRAAGQFQDETHISLLPSGEWQRLFALNGYMVVILGTDAHWDTPYPGPKLRNAFCKIETQLRFASRYASPNLSTGENLVGLHRCV